MYHTQKAIDFGVEWKIIFLMRTHGVKQSRCLGLESRFEFEFLLCYLEDAYVGQATKPQVLHSYNGNNNAHLARLSQRPAWGK